LKPVILITASLSETDDVLKSRHQLNELYSRCLCEVGLIPVIACGADPIEYINFCDAILFSGGVDVEPHRFGETTLNDTVTCDPVRDTEELALFDAFYRAGKPIFGICRGIQLINVALGGTLYQDIPSQIKTNLQHAGNGTHTIEISDGTILSKLFHRNKLTVNSYHHQCIKEPGKGLIVNAVSDDGIIEGVESKNGQILAVQWHPERITLDNMASERDNMMPFFAEMQKRIKGEYHG